jgi:hypothetical protein
MLAAMFAISTRPGRGEDAFDPRFGWSRVERWTTRSVT